MVQKPDINIENACSIGRANECAITGCKWKIVCGEYCWDKRLQETPKVEVSYVEPKRSPKPITYKRFVPAEDTKPFYARRKKKKKKIVVSDEQKFAESITPPPVPLKTQETDLSKKIKVNKQDDWITKIKTPDENKNW